MSLKRLLRTNLSAFYTENPFEEQFPAGGVDLDNTNALNEGPALEGAFEGTVPGNIVFRSIAPPVATDSILNKAFQKVGISKNVGKIDTNTWSDGLDGYKSMYPLIWSNIDPIDKPYSPPIQNTSLYKTVRLASNSVIDGLRLTRFFSPISFSEDNPLPQDANGWDKFIKGIKDTNVNYFVFKGLQRSLALQTPLVRGVERGFNILNIVATSATQGVGTRLRTAYSAPLTGLSLDALRGGNFRPNLDIFGSDKSNYFGLTKTDDDTTLITKSSENGGYNIPASRLPGLYYRKIAGYQFGTEDRNNITAGGEESGTLLRYFGGPSAPLGFLGQTTITRWEFTNSKKVLDDAGNIFTAFSDQSFTPKKPSSEQSQPISFKDGKIVSSGPSFVSTISRYVSFNKENQPGTQNGYGMSQGGTLTYGELPKDSQGRVDFLKSTKRNLDYINAKEDFTADEYADNANLIKYSIEILNNDTSGGQLGASDYLYFRAFIDNFQDTYKPKWDAYKYVGRAESFHRYSAFDRDISLSFTIAAFARKEMIPLYNKINRLVGITAPDYSGVGLMRGQIIRLTVGDYLTSVPGILTGLSLEPIFEAGWDINRDNDGYIVSRGAEGYTGQLPIAIKVNGFNFTPIHNFTPVKNSQFINFGDTSYISQADGSTVAAQSTNTNTPTITPLPPNIQLGQFTGKELKGDYVANLVRQEIIGSNPPPPVSGRVNNQPSFTSIIDDTPPDTFGPINEPPPDRWPNL